MHPEVGSTAKSAFFFENWNRYYDPMTGRYLSPEPLQESPLFVLNRVQATGVPAVYAYVSNAPTYVVDVDGLHDTNGCKGGSTCDECAKMAAGINDAALKKCVVAQCVSKSTKLKCDDKVKEDCKDDLEHTLKGTKKGGGSALGSIKKPVKEIAWCEVKTSSTCETKTLVHELAHSCGWDHGDDPGVPGNNKDGRIEGCEAK